MARFQCNVRQIFLCIALQILTHEQWNFVRDGKFLAAEISADTVIVWRVYVATLGFACLENRLQGHVVLCKIYFCFLLCFNFKYLKLLLVRDHSCKQTWYFILFLIPFITDCFHPWHESFVFRKFPHRWYECCVVLYVTAPRSMVGEHSYLEEPATGIFREEVDCPKDGNSLQFHGRDHL
jgi:hypothetical protein